MIDLPKMFRSFRHAARGVVSVFRFENNARVHGPAAGVVILLGVVLDISRADWLWLLAAVAAVWITETINTAFEKLVDLVSPDYHPLAGQVKDLAAGAVLLAAIFAVLVGLLTLGPYLMEV
ncbi:MAG: diacylglycerol kinase family protein [Catalinimonas sp.]